ncbi:MAG: substrate-binding domain-containing protein [Opitutales bacterium]|nr:substrate-binding domain-containing protein [Opitutales bacterium]
MRTAERTSNKIYLSLHRKQHWAHTVLPGIAQHIRNHTNFYMVYYPPEEVLEILTEDSERPAGFIGHLYTSEMEMTRLLRERSIPAVNLAGLDPPEGVTTVTHDNVAIGRMGGDHLRRLGRRHFYFFGLGDHLLSHQRLAGFSASLAEVGCEVSEAVFLGSRVNFPDWLSSLKLPAAIFCASDSPARKICDAAARLGMSVPSDLAVLGVDNDPFECELTRIPLSSIALRSEELGRQAALRLDNMMRGVDMAPQTQVIPPSHIEIRLSTDYLAVEDDLIRRAIQHIRMPREDPLSVGELANELHVSRRVLEKRFRAARGHTAFDEIHIHRMERARGLVEETNLTVGQVSERIGLADTKRFISLFRERFGRTPHAYRRAMHS